MKKKLRLNKYKKINVVTVFLVLDIIIMFAFFTTSNATYSSQAIGSADMSVALYAFSYDGMDSVDASGNEDAIDINLGDFAPGETKYYKFRVYNSNEDGYAADTDLAYQLKIITTTNLDLDYKLYYDQSAFRSGSTDILETDTVVKGTITDDWGTSFNSFAVDEKCFLYEEDASDGVTNVVKYDEYTLRVQFPSTYISNNYQDVVESIKIQLTSHQIRNTDAISQSGICK